MTQNMIKTWGKHLAAIAVLLVITIAYFSPAVLDGKVIQQGDMLKAEVCLTSRVMAIRLPTCRSING